MATTWYTTPDGHKRLSFEQMLLGQSFPSWLPLRRKTDGTVFVRGPLRSSVTGNIYAVRIEYPVNYPFSPPEAYFEQPLKLVHPVERAGRTAANSPHHHGAALCLLNPSCDWLPMSHNLGTIIAFANRWILAYEQWAMCGRWPEN